MAEDLSNVQHNLNADVDISFESGLDSILKFAEQIETVNSAFSKLSTTTETLEDKVIQKFNSLSKLFKDSTKISDINTTVAKKIQQKISRYISNYIDTLDFKDVAGITSQKIADPQKIVDKFSKNIIDAFGDITSSLQSAIDKGKYTGAKKTKALALINNLNKIRDDFLNSYKNIIDDTTLSIDERIKKLSDIKPDVQKIGTENFINKLQDNLNKIFGDFIDNYSKSLTSQTKKSEIVELSSAKSEVIKKKIKQAIIDIINSPNLEIKFNIKNLSLNINADTLKNKINDAINNIIRSSQIEFENPTLVLQNKISEINSKIKEYEDKLISLTFEGETPDIQKEKTKYTNALIKAKENQQKLVMELNNLQSNTLYLTQENLKQLWKQIQDKFAELFVSANLTGLDKLEPIKADKIKQLLIDIRNTLEKSLDNLKIDDETLNKIPELTKAIEEFNTGISDIVKLMSDLNKTFSSKQVKVLKKSLTKINESLANIKEKIDQYVIDYINKIIPEDLTPSVDASKINTLISNIAEKIDNYIIERIDKIVFGGFLSEITPPTTSTNVKNKINKNIENRIKELQEQISIIDSVISNIDVNNQEGLQIALSRRKLLTEELERLKASTGEEVLEAVSAVRKETLIPQNLMQKFIEKFTEQIESMIDVSKISGLDVIREKILVLNKNFEELNQNLQVILSEKQSGIDKEITILKTNIEELGKNFNNINSMLKSADVGGLQSAINTFENNFKKLEQMYHGKTINVNISDNIKNITDNLKALQKELNDFDNGIIASQIVAVGIKQKIEQFVKSLMDLSSKIINIDTTSLNISLTPEQIQAIKAQLENVKIVNIDEISGPINTALKNLLDNAGKIIENQLTNIINQKDVQIPKIQVKGIISQLTALINTFMTGYINAISENAIVYKPLEIKTKDLPQTIKNSLAQRFNMSVEDYLKSTPTIKASDVLIEIFQQNLNRLNGTLYNIIIRNERNVFNKYNNAIKNIQIKPDKGFIPVLESYIKETQSLLIKKIESMINIQFTEINKYIKNMKTLPLGFNYRPTSVTNITKDIQANIPLDSLPTKSIGAKASIPRGNINLSIPQMSLNDVLDLDTVYERSGGLSNYLSNRTLLTSILNTIRYIIAGALLKIPYSAIYKGWESAKNFELLLTKAQTNLMGSSNEQFLDYARIRIEKAVETGVTNALSYLRGKTDIQSMINAEAEYLKNYITNDVRKDLQELSLKYVIPQSQAAQLFEIASRSTMDPFEARAITEAAMRIFAAEPGAGTSEEIADALQATIVQMGMSGFDAKRLSEIFFNISTKFKVTTHDLLKFASNAGAVISSELSYYETDELKRLRNQIQLSTGDRRKELEEEYKRVKLDTDLAITGLLGALISESSNRTGTEAARMMIQFFNALNTSEIRQFLEGIISSYPKYANVLPYKYTPDEQGYPFTERTSGVEAFFSILRLASEMEAGGDAKLATEMLRKVFGRYLGVGQAVDKLIENIVYRMPEYREKGEDVIEGIINDLKENSEEFMDMTIARNNLTLSKQTERLGVVWESAVGNVFLEFKDDVSYIASTITDVLKAIRDNAEFVSGLVRQLINVLIGAGIRYFGEKTLNRINANVLAIEREQVIEPWKSALQERLAKRQSLQKQISEINQKRQAVEDRLTKYEERLEVLMGKDIKGRTEEESMHIPGEIEKMYHEAESLKDKVNNIKLLKNISQILKKDNIDFNQIMHDYDESVSRIKKAIEIRTDIIEGQQEGADFNQLLDEINILKKYDASTNTINVSDYININRIKYNKLKKILESPPSEKRTQELNAILQEVLKSETEELDLLYKLRDTYKRRKDFNVYDAKGNLKIQGNYEKTVAKIIQKEKYIEQLKNFNLSDAKLEHILKYIDMPINFVEELSDEDINALEELATFFEDQYNKYNKEANDLLKKISSTRNTLLSLSSMKQEKDTEFVNLNKEIEEYAKVIQHIIKAYKDLGAAPLSKAGKKTESNELKNIGIIKNIADLKNRYVNTVTDIVSRISGKKIDREEVESVINSALGGDYSKADKIFGKDTKKIITGYKEVSEQSDLAEKLYVNLTQQQQIRKEIEKLKESDELKPFKDYIAPTGEIQKEKLYTEQFENKYEKPIEQFEKVLKNISETNAGKALDNLRVQLSNLAKEATALAEASRKASMNQALLTDNIKQLVIEKEYGQIEDSKFLEKLKEEQGIQQPTISSILSGILGSITGGLKSMLINWAIGATTSFVMGSLSQLFESTKTTKQTRYLEAKSFAETYQDINNRMEEAFNMARNVRSVSDFFDYLSYGISTGLRALVFNMSELIKHKLGLDFKHRLSKELREKLKAGGQERAEALAQLEEEAIKAAYEEEKLNAEIEAAIFEKVSRAIRNKDYDEFKEQVRSYNADILLEYINKMVSPKELEINYRTTIDKLNLRQKGYRETSKEMLEVEIKSASELAELYKNAAQSIRLKIKAMEEEYGEEQKALLLSNETYLKLKEALYKYDEAAAKAESVVKDIFSRIEKLFSNIETDLNNALIKINIFDIQGKLNRWLSGIAEDSGVAVDQQLEVLRKRVEEYRKAVEKEKAELETISEEDMYSDEYKAARTNYEEAKKKYEKFITTDTNLQATDKSINIYNELLNNLKNARQKYENIIGDDIYSDLYKDVLAKYESAVERLLQAEYDLQVAEQQVPRTAAESLMNKAAAAADIDARIATAQAQLKGLSEDSLYIRLIQKQRLEQINKAYNILLEELQKSYEEGKGDTEKIWLEIRDIQAKQLENLVAIKKLNENRVSFNLPEGLRIMTYNDYLQSIGNEQSFTAQFKAFNLNINFGDVIVRSDTDIRNIVRDVTNSVNHTFKNGLRIR